LYNKHIIPSFLCQEQIPSFVVFGSGYIYPFKNQPLLYSNYFLCYNFVGILFIFTNVARKSLKRNKKI